MANSIWLGRIQVRFSLVMLPVAATLLFSTIDSTIANADHTCPHETLKAFQLKTGVRITPDADSVPASNDRCVFLSDVPKRTNLTLRTYDDVFLIAKDGTVLKTKPLPDFTESVLFPIGGKSDLYVLQSKDLQGITHLQYFNSDLEFEGSFFQSSNTRYKFLYVPMVNIPQGLIVVFRQDSLDFVWSWRELDLIFHDHHRRTILWNRTLGRGFFTGASASGCDYSITPTPAEPLFYHFSLSKFELDNDYRFIAQIDAFGGHYWISSDPTCAPSTQILELRVLLENGMIHKSPVFSESLK